MKILITGAAMVAFLSFSATSEAQKIKLASGDLAALKNETSINFEFTYDHMSVGKYDTEKEYVDKKTSDYNAKEAGRGDTWAKNWVADRQSRFEPKFIELFTKTSEMTESKTAKYTIIFKTKSTEPGYNVAVMRKNAKIDAEALIVETADKSKVIATVTVDNVPGRTFGGYDFDTGERLAECYADAGKHLAKFIRKN